MKKYLSIKDFHDHMKSCKDKREFQKLKAIFLYKIHKKTAKEIALIIHTSPNNIYQWAHKYKKNGFYGLKSKPRGGRRRGILTLEEEKAVLNQIAEDSNKGLIVTANQVKKIVEERKKNSVFKNYAYSLLKRHKWRKIVPRPKNPKSSTVLQETFKKDFNKLVIEQLQTFDKQDKRPVIVLFEDEARFGRISLLRKCWSPAGMRPIVGAQLVRQFLYVFSVVCPITGSNYSLIFSDTDTEMMNVFLNEVSNHYCNYRIIIVADQASWHKSKDLRIFDNIRFLYLPAGSPELNPTEHLWEYVREKYFANKVIDSIESVQEILVQVFEEIHYNPNSIQSLVSFHWAKLNLIA